MIPGDDTTETSPAAARFTDLVAAFSGRPGVTHDARSASGKRFGSNALKVEGKIFAMLVKGELVVKLPRQRVDALVESAAGKRFDTGAGRVMREWVSLPADSPADGQALADEALAFVGRAT